jgi:hypothetical protein
VWTTSLPLSAMKQAQCQNAASNAEFVRLIQVSMDKAVAAALRNHDRLPVAATTGLMLPNCNKTSIEGRDPPGKGTFQADLRPCCVWTTSAFTRGNTGESNSHSDISRGTCVACH